MQIKHQVAMKNLSFGFGLLVLASAALFSLTSIAFAIGFFGDFSLVNIYPLPLFGLLMLVLNSLIFYGLEAKKVWSSYLASMELMIFLSIALLNIWTINIPTILLIITTITTCSLGLKTLYIDITKRKS